MSLYIKNIENCWVSPLILDERFRIFMTLEVSCTRCNVTKEVGGQPDSFLQPVTLGCSQCGDVCRLTEVTVGDIIYTAFEKGECWTHQHLKLWSSIFTSPTPFKTFLESLDALM